MKRLYLLLFPFSIGILLSCHERLDKDISSNFIGTWTLVKCIAIERDSIISYPYGERPTGQILYDAKGNMMVEIINTDTKKFNNPSPFKGTPDEIIPAYNGLIAYYGTYTILADSSLVIHTIKACSFPNWTGQNQKRRYQFENNRLILRTPPISSIQYELTWEKN